MTTQNKMQLKNFNTMVLQMVQTNLNMNLTNNQLNTLVKILSFHNYVSVLSNNMVKIHASFNYSLFLTPLRNYTNRAIRLTN